MYNNFSSKKTKKVISALLASALVVTSGPITADAATAKVVGIKKSITVSASATNKVTGLSKAEKKIVKVTKKGKKFTIKGLKAGKATFKIGKKSYTVKVGATTVKAAKTKLTLTKGKAATLKFTTKSGNGDTLTFKASNKNVTLAKKSAKIAKSAASVKATAKKAGKTTITATSKATGKKATVTVTVKNAAKPATTTPGASNTPVATATGSATNTPEATATATATATASGSATNTPDVTATPVATATGTATATPVATGSATSTPEATEVPTEAPTKAPEVVTGGTITVTGTAVSGATIVVTNVSGAAVDTTKRLPAGTYTVSVTKDGYIAQTKEVTIADKDAKVVEINLEKMLEVASVKALNRAEIEVTFTKALTTAQETAAKTTTNYTVTKEGATTSTTVKTVTVANDAKSVILLLDSTLDNGKTANTVKVAKAIGMFADYTDTKVASEDVNIPQVSKVSVVGNRVIKIQFTEAIKLINAHLNADGTIAYDQLRNYFSVKGATTTNATEQVTNGTNATTKADSGNPTTATLSENGRTITLTFDNKLAVDNYTVLVKADKLQDYAGYKVSEVAKTVSISSSETVAKVVSVEAKSREKVAVTFDSAVTASGTLSWKTATGQGSTTTAELQADNKTIVYTFTGANVMKAGSTTFTLQGVADAYGYTVADTTKTVDVPEETAATATVKSTADNKFVVTFDKAMQNKDGNTAGDSTNKESYSIVDPKGKAVALTNATISVDSTKKIVTITTSDNLASGDYTVTVSGVKDTMGVEMTKAVASVAVKDTTRPTVVGNAIYSGKKIAITYSETMATSGTRSVVTASNYTYGGAALPKETTLQVSSDGKTVIITLPDTVDTSKALVIGGVDGDIYTVADAAGNILDDGTGNYTKQPAYAADAPAYIAASAVSAVDAHTIRVAVGGATLETVYASDFEYTIDNGTTYNDVTAAKLVTVNSEQYIDFTISSTLSAAVDASKVKVRAKKVAANVEYKSVTALGTTLKRLSGGNEVANTDAVTTPQESATISASTTTWPFRTALKSAEVLNNTTVKVTFDGLVNETNFNNIIKITNDTTDKTFADANVKVLDDGKSVLITVASLDTSKPVTVKTVLYKDVAVASWAKDGNGMKYTENTTGIQASVVSDLKVMSVNTGIGADGVVHVADYIEINFNQAIVKESIKSTGWSLISGNTYDITSGTVYEGGYVLTSQTVKIGTNGEITINGTNFGKLSGFTALSTSDVATGVLAIDPTCTHVKFVYGTASKLLVNGTVTYTPSAEITSASTDKKIVVDTTNVVTADAAPVIASATVSSDDKVITIKFSEAMDETKIFISGTELNTSNVAVTAKDGEVSASLSSDKKTLTLTKTTGFSSADTADGVKLTNLTGIDTKALGTVTLTVTGSSGHLHF